MSQKTIHNYDELRDSVALINNGVLEMCNAKTTDDVVNAFLPLSDLLAAVFRYNVLRVSPKSETTDQETE